MGWPKPSSMFWAPSSFSDASSLIDSAAASRAERASSGSVASASASPKVFSISATRADSDDDSSHTCQVGQLPQRNRL